MWGEAKDLNSVLYGLKNYKAGNEIDSNKEFIETTLRKLDLFPNEWTWLPKEKKIIQESLKREQELYDQARSGMKLRIDTKERAFGVITLGSKISLVCSRILNDNPALDYIICINSYRGINGKLSFRTKKDDLDLNCFAGVSGHAKAAGAKVTPETADKIWREDFVPVYEDELKEDAIPAVTEMKHLGHKLIMLTGDRKEIGQKVALMLGLDEVYAELLPADKVEKFEQLLQQKAPQDKMLFVGDGINDAPVLARSDVGVAMGAIGSDAALEAADIILMEDEPSGIIKAIRIAKATLRSVKQNMIFAVGMKIILIILAFFGFVTMQNAIIADMAVMLINILNSFWMMHYPERGV